MLFLPHFLILHNNDNMMFLKILLFRIFLHHLLQYLFLIGIIDIQVVHLLGQMLHSVRLHFLYNHLFLFEVLLYLLYIQFLLIKNIAITTNVMNFMDFLVCIKIFLNILISFLCNSIVIIL